MGRVVARLQSTRSEREEQTQYLRALLARSVALICVDARSQVQLLNSAAQNAVRDRDHTELGICAARGLIRRESGILAPRFHCSFKDGTNLGTATAQGCNDRVFRREDHRRLISLQNIEQR